MLLVDLPHDLLVRILRASPSLQQTMICLRLCKALAHAAADDSVWFSLRGGSEDASTKQPEASSFSGFVDASGTIPGEILTNRLKVCIFASLRAIRRQQKCTLTILGSDQWADEAGAGDDGELNVEQWARLATDIFSVCQAKDPHVFSEQANVLLALRHDTAVSIACVVEDEMIKLLERSMLMAVHRCHDPTAADSPGLHDVYPVDPRDTPQRLDLPNSVFKAYPMVLLADVLLAMHVGHVEETNFFGMSRKDWNPAVDDRVLGKLFRLGLTRPSVRLLRCLARRAGIVRISWNALEHCWSYLLSRTAHAVMRASAVAWTTSPALAQLDALDAACERVNAELGHDDDDPVEEGEGEGEEPSFADELSFSFFDNPQPGAFMSEIPIQTIDFGTEEVASKEAWFHARHSTWVVMPTPGRIAGAYGRDNWIDDERTRPSGAWTVTVSSGLFMGRFLGQPGEESENESSDDEAYDEGDWSVDDEPEFFDE